MRKSGGWYLDRCGCIRRELEEGGCQCQCQCPLTFFADRIGIGSFEAGSEKLKLTNLEQRDVLVAADTGFSGELRTKLLKAARII